MHMEFPTQTAAACPKTEMDDTGAPCFVYRTTRFAPEENLHYPWACLLCLAALGIRRLAFDNYCRLNQKHFLQANHHLV